MAYSPEGCGCLVEEDLNPRKCIMHTNGWRDWFVAGEMDFLKPYGLELLESCVDSVVVKHPKGHTIPRLGKDNINILFSCISFFFCGILLLCVCSGFAHRLSSLSSFQMNKAWKPLRASLRRLKICWPRQKVLIVL